MKRSLLLFMVLLLCASAAFGKKADTTGIRQATLRLNAALVARDTATIKAMLHKKVGYGHSNGWVQSRTQVMKDLWNGKLRYTAIDEGDWQAAKVGDAVVVRAATEVAFELDGQAMQMKLHVMQVWQRKGKKVWVLVARQSCKV